MVREKFDSLPLNKILDLFKLKEFADEHFKFNENGRKFSNRFKTLITSNFSFSHGVFKRLVDLLQTCKNHGLFFGKGLMRKPHQKAHLEGIDRCTGRLDETEIMMKKLSHAIKTTQKLKVPIAPN